MRAHLPLLLILLSTPALAGGDLDSLLNSIPDAKVEQTEAAKPDAEAPVDTEVTLPMYVHQVESDIFASWTPKAKVLKKAPKANASFLIRIGREGEFLGVSPMNLSGVKAFDQSALDAITSAAPYPMPPRALDGDADRGIVVTFKARQALKK